MTQVSAPVPLLQMQNITKSFGPKPVLADFNLSIGQQEIVTLLGPSGCGKTTVLRLIAGLETPQKGQIFLNGEDITQLPCPQRKINTVFQNYALFPHLNVYDNIAFGPRMKKGKQEKIPESEIRGMVEEMLALVKLPGMGSRFPHQLSGGQQQRVALARALINRPQILLLDESLSALDKDLRLTMQMELKGLQRKLKTTFVFVTHDQEEALSLSDKIVVMNHGKIEQIGTPREVYEGPKNLFVASFIGQSNFFPAVVKDVTSEGRMRLSLPQLADHVEYEFNRKGQFQAGDQVKILLRAEDLKIYSQSHAAKPDPSVPIFRGKVLERTYKGMTLDSLIRISHPRPEFEQDILAREFFDEENPDFDYAFGEEVLISWNKNWEVILPHEDR